MPAKLMTDEEFKEEYLRLKEETGLPDYEIADLMYMSTDALFKYKKRLKLKVKYIKKNKVGLTEAQLQTAEKNGIKRSVALTRVREYGWDEEKAITNPIIPVNKRQRKSKYGITEEHYKRAEAKGLARKTLWHRVGTKKMDIEEAINKPKGKKRKSGSI
jgi:hypothetical protein